MAITSVLLRGLYTQSSRDESVSEFQDYAGLRVVRKYDQSFTSLQDKKMTLGFVIKKDGGWDLVSGNVSMNKMDEHFGWVIDSTDGEGKIFQRPSNFSFGNFSTEPERIIFDATENLFVFGNHKYTANQFVDFLEKNHMRDMFLVSRMTSFCKLLSLHILFFLTDSQFKKFEELFKRLEKNRSQIPVKNESISIEGGDPLFHFFNIYKNLLGTTFALLLIAVFYITNNVDVSASVLSPSFLTIAALSILYVLDRASDLLHWAVNHTDLVERITASTFDQKSRLIHFPS